MEWVAIVGAGISGIGMLFAPDNISTRCTVSFWGFLIMLKLGGFK
jgi:hypothetical protein